MRCVELRFAAVISRYDGDATRGMTVMAETHLGARAQIEALLDSNEFIYDLFIDV